MPTTRALTDLRIRRRALHVPIRLEVNGSHTARRSVKKKLIISVLCGTGRGTRDVRVDVGTHQRIALESPVALDRLGSGLNCPDAPAQGANCDVVGTHDVAIPLNQRKGHLAETKKNNV